MKKMETEKEIDEFIIKNWKRLTLTERNLLITMGVYPKNE